MLPQGRDDVAGVTSRTANALENRGVFLTRPRLMAIVNVNTPPNNLGATLLIATGLVSAPTGLGIGVLLMGLALLKEADGQHCFPRLHMWVRRIQKVQFWRASRL